MGERFFHTTLKNAAAACNLQREISLGVSENVISAWQTVCTGWWELLYLRKHTFNFVGVIAHECPFLLGFVKTHQQAEIWQQSRQGRMVTFKTRRVLTLSGSKDRYAHKLLGQC